jgi:cysteinyl-tRNA synthetase
MALHLYNTMSSRIEEFHSLRDHEVRMYACGPTVYDYGHIGNFRTFVAVDLLQRFLRQSGYSVRYVMNITDVDDKIIRNAVQASISVQQFTKKYETAFTEDSAMINIEPPKFVRATENIPQMAGFVEKLVEKGFAYRTDDGSYYFRIAKFPQYGKLAKKDFQGMLDGARVDVDEYDKDSARDFALWKGPKPNEASWDTAIGPGRPGWHLECSVMSMQELGDSFDLHAGGEDLIFPHHENEIAQSEAATGHPFVKIWLHAEHLIIDGEKMSKSLGNFFTLRDLFAKGQKPSAIRYLLMSVPYRRQLNFTGDSITQAANSVTRLRTFYARLKNEQFKAGETPEIQKRAAKAEADFDSGLADDLNTAFSLAVIFDLVRDVNTAMDKGEFRQQDAPRLIAAMEKFDAIFAILIDDDAEILQRMGFASGESRMPEPEVEALVEERNAAKKKRDFKRADEIRKKLTDSGIILEDIKDGSVRWKYK